MKIRIKPLLALLTLFAVPLFSQTEKGVNPVKSSASESGEAWAVIAGISNYQNPDITDLQYAHSDAAAFAQYLQSPSGGGLDSSHITLLLDEKATAGQFALALDWLLEKAKEGDQAIIYFSGHGDVERKTITQPGFLLCWDAPPRVYMGGGTFGLLYLQEVISTLSLQTKARVLVITDACRAGKLAGSEIGGTQATAANLAKQYASEVKIMSCQPDELSLEGPDWGGGRGVFSYFFLQGMEGLADKNADGLVSLFEIERYLGDEVPAATNPHSQIPMTVGSKSAVVARVDPAALLALKSRKDPNAGAGLMVSNDKGIAGALEASGDSAILKLYNDFKKALKEGRLLYPEAGSAWALFQELKDKPVMAPYQGQMRRNLAATLQDDAQQAINDYLEADPTELRNRWSYDDRYDRFPEYLGKAAELLGENHFLYKNLKAREHYFSGLNLRLRGERAKDAALFRQAINEQNQALRLDSNAAYACNELGLLARRLKNYKESAEYFKQAIVRSPGWVLPWANLCGVYLDLDAYSDAETAGKEAVRLDSTFALAQYNLGVAYQSLSNPSKAKIHYQKSIFYDPDYVLAYFNLGLIYYWENDWEQAEQMWTFYHQRVPADADILVNLGEVALKRNQKEKALSFYQEALELDPKNIDGHLSLGQFYLNEGKYKEADSAFSRYLELKPDDAVAYYHLACSKTLQDQAESAAQQLEKAFSFDKDRKILREEKRLEPLRRQARFVALLDQYAPGWKK